MAALKINKALYAILALVMAGLFLIVNNAMRPKSPSLLIRDQGDFMERAPTPKTADADTTKDTLIAIKGHMTNTQKNAEAALNEVERIKVQKQGIERENLALARRFEQQLDNVTQQQQHASDQRLDRVIGKIDEMMSVMQENLSAQQELGVLSAETTLPAPMPTLLPDGFAPAVHQYQRGEFVAGTQLLDIFWIEPLDDTLNTTYGRADASASMHSNIDERVTPNTIDRQILTPLAAPVSELRRYIDGDKRASLYGGTSDTTTIGGRGRSLPRRRQLAPTNNTYTNNTQAIQPVPGRLSAAPARQVFTLPDTSLLADSTAITALVGKVYFNGDIVNPRLFKIKVGRHNVTSNGVSLPPQVQGMVMEGFAVGEYSTSCIRGSITAATFVFADGTIKSIYPGDAGSRPNSAGVSRRLGYITDRWGNDCIPGKLISDGAQYLAESFLIAGAAGYVEGLRNTQVRRRTIVGADGSESVVSTVEGDPQAYARSSALSGGLGAAVEYMKQRQGVSNDLIYLPAGQRVDVHLQQELRLDIYDNSRQVHYRGDSAHVKNDLD